MTYSESAKELPLPMSDRLPPQSAAAEEALLGGCLLDPEAIARVIDFVSPPMFYTGPNQILFQAMVSLHRNNIPPDLEMVHQWLKDKNKLDQAGGRKALVRLLDKAVTSANVDAYAQVVREKYERRLLLRSSREIEKVARNEALPIDEVFESAESSAFSVFQTRHQQAGLAPLSETLSGTFEEVEARNLRQSALLGIPSGYYDLDEMTQGFQRSDLIVVAGRPSMGKTSFLLSVARNVAVNEKLPVAIFSLEMSKEQLTQRLLSSEVRIESGRLRAGKIYQNEWEPLGHAIGSLSQVPIFLDDTPNISITEMRSKARRLQAEQGGALGLVVLDYLQLMDGGSDNRVQELSKITRALKSLARELNVPLIALSQLSRNVDARTNKRPLMSDLRESGSIEQDSDVVIFLYRDEYYDPNSPDRGIAEVIISKHRNGPTGTVKLLFEPQFTQFRNLKSFKS